MPGLFQGLEIGKRALLTHQLNLQTIGHNIANVNTPGYSRQRVNISQTNPEQQAYGSIGTGITAEDIRHARDFFLSQQYRQASKSLGQWSYKQKTMTQIESVFNEPQSDSVSDLLDGFWNAWSDLSTQASSTNAATARTNVLGEATKLVNGLHELANRLQNLRDSVDSDLQNYTNEINKYTAEIAQLNQQIASSELGGTPANDLRDQRDLMTDQLASIIDVRVTEKPNGTTIVSMGAMVLVDSSDDFPIGSNVVNENGHAIHELVWRGTDVKLTNLNGELYGLIQSRDEVLPRYIDELNTLTGTIIEQVNSIHMSGYGAADSTDVPFFDPTFTEAATIRINQAIMQDSNKIAASSTASPAFDNAIALAISELRNLQVMDKNTSTMGDYYTSLVGKLGIETSEASAFSQNYELLVQQVDNSRQSVQGVSLDEEMANMIKFQHAYDAAARVITTMDQALDTVIHGMGTVGR
ncbi:MAG: flagellar hook-associated protein FlgK [bacterium]|nr:flagellar hook-associated protein FlgK [bacterium]